MAVEDGPRRLRVAVPASLTRLSPRTGHGRVWRHVLEQLDRATELVPIELRPYSSQWRPERDATVTVWLTDGHARALEVDAPVVAAVHEVGWITPELRAHLDPAFGAMITGATAASLARADRVLVPSVSARQEVIDANDLPGSRIDVVPYGVDLDVFAPGLPGGSARVAAARGQAERPYVLFVSSVFPRKNIEVVRHAVAQLAAHGHEHVLALVLGAAPDRPDSVLLRRHAEAELPGLPGRIVSIGGGDDPALAALMAGADAVCLPSLSEGFGLTALEAMACGAPLVASDRGALPEVVGDGGLCVAPTVEAVRDGLLAILNGARPDLRARARARAEQFPWSRTAAGWLAALERAAAEQRSPRPASLSVR